MQQLLSDLPDSTPEEIVDVLINNPSIRIERIVSTGHRSPEGFWYDQHENEWVLVLQGHARLRFDDGSEVQLEAGSAINIPARKRHRVEWTSSDTPTVWLAVFYHGDPSNSETKG